MSAVSAPIREHECDPVVPEFLAFAIDNVTSLAPPGGWQRSE
jgi:hypothetical protein